MSDDKEQSGLNNSDTADLADQIVPVYTDNSCQGTDNGKVNDEKKDLRKSIRSKKPKQIFTPEEVSHRKKKRKNMAPDRAFDTLPDGKPFCCDLCKSPYIIDKTSKQALKNKRSRHVPDPKHKVDPWTGKILVLCNSCALTFDGALRPKKSEQPPVISADDRAEYIEKVKSEAKELAEKYQISEAYRFYCPVFVRKKCRCIQKYFTYDVDEETTKKRMQDFVDLYMEAKSLSQQKAYIPIPVPNSSGKKTKKVKNLIPIGLGNGHKRSREFSTFVLGKRLYLKEEAGLCERGTQRVLLYSNNFLHKKLKTEQSECRVKPLKGKAKLGQLETFDDMSKKRCCVDNCVMMALTHRKLLQQWRERARTGQANARRVIAEMLTPSAGARCNCYNFITRVTGSSRSTIVQVNQQMLKTGGEREPPLHGLKKFWQGSKKDTSKTSMNEQSTTKAETLTSPMAAQQEMTSSTVVNLIPNLVNLDLMQQQQLLQLQQQMFDQQLQLQQQHHSLQQHLLQHSMLQHIGGSDNTSQSLSLIQQMIEQLNIQIHSTQTQLQQSLQHLHNMIYSVQHLQNQLSTSSGVVTPQSGATQMVLPQSATMALPQVQSGGAQVVLPQGGTMALPQVQPGSAQIVLPQGATTAIPGITQMVLPQGTVGLQAGAAQLVLPQGTTGPNLTAKGGTQIPAGGQLGMSHHVPDSTVQQETLGTQIQPNGGQIVLPQGATSSQIHCCGGGSQFPQEVTGTQPTVQQGALGSQIHIDAQLGLQINADGSHSQTVGSQFISQMPSNCAQFLLNQAAASSPTQSGVTQIVLPQGANNSQLPLPQGASGTPLPVQQFPSASFVQVPRKANSTQTSISQIVSGSQLTVPQSSQSTNLSIQVALESNSSTPQVMGSHISEQSASHSSQFYRNESQSSTWSSENPSDLNGSSKAVQQNQNLQQGLYGHISTGNLMSDSISSQYSDMSSASTSIKQNSQPTGTSKDANTLQSVTSIPVMICQNQSVTQSAQSTLTSQGQRSHNVLVNQQQPLISSSNSGGMEIQQGTSEFGQNQQEQRIFIPSMPSSEVTNLTSLKESHPGTFYQTQQTPKRFSSTNSPLAAAAKNIILDQNQDLQQTTPLSTQANRIRVMGSLTNQSLATQNQGLQETTHLATQANRIQVMGSLANQQQELHETTPLATQAKRIQVVETLSNQNQVNQRAKLSVNKQTSTNVTEFSGNQIQASLSDSSQIVSQTNVVCTNVQSDKCPLQTVFREKETTGTQQRGISPLNLLKPSNFSLPANLLNPESKHGQSGECIPVVSRQSIPTSQAVYDQLILPVKLVKKCALPSQNSVRTDGKTVNSISIPNISPGNVTPMYNHPELSQLLSLTAAHRVQNNTDLATPSVQTFDQVTISQNSRTNNTFSNMETMQSAGTPYIPVSMQQQNPSLASINDDPNQQSSFIVPQTGMNTSVCSVGNQQSLSNHHQKPSGGQNSAKPSQPPRVVQPLLTDSSGGTGIQMSHPQIFFHPQTIVSAVGDCSSQQKQSSTTDIVAQPHILVSPPSGVFHQQQRPLHLNIQLQTNSPNDISNVAQLLQNADLSNLPLSVGQVILNLTNDQSLQTALQSAKSVQNNPTSVITNITMSGSEMASTSLAGRSVPVTCISQASKVGMIAEPSLAISRGQVNQTCVNTTIVSAPLTTSASLNNATAQTTWVTLNDPVSFQNIYNLQSLGLTGMQSKRDIHVNRQLMPSAFTALKTTDLGIISQRDGIPKSISRTTIAGNITNTTYLNTECRVAGNNHLSSANQGTGYTQGHLSNFQGHKMAQHNPGEIQMNKSDRSAPQHQVHSVPFQGHVSLNNIPGQEQRHNVPRQGDIQVQGQSINTQGQGQDLGRGPQSTIVQGIIQGQNVPVNCTLVLHTNQNTISNTHIN